MLLTGWTAFHKGRKIGGSEKEVNDLTLVLGMVLSGSKCSGSSGWLAEKQSVMH